MNEKRVLKRVRLTPAHKQTGNTRHYRGGSLLPLPAELQIVQIADDPELYLLHFDMAGAEQTDTYHESIADTIAQADWEVQIREHEWIDVVIQ